MDGIKNVVIIGASAGGAQTARALQKRLPVTHRIVLIEANEFAFWIVGALRAAVMPGYENKVFASLDTIFPATSRHILLKKMRVVEIASDHVRLDRVAPAPFESDRIEVDVGIISTGLCYPYPMVPFSQNWQESINAFRCTQADIAAAKNVVILGGGAVGVEFAGEVRELHRDTQITLLERSPQLLKGWREPLHAQLLAQLERLSVDVRLNTSIQVTDELRASAYRLLSPVQQLAVSDGTKVDCDFLFIDTGGGANASALNSDALTDSVQVRKSESRSTPPRYVDVDPRTLRLKYEPLQARWFCVGDAANTSDPKTYSAAEDHARVVADQVLGQVLNISSGLKEHSKATSLMSVSLGTSGGATQLVWPVFGKLFTSLIKSRSLGLSAFKNRYSAVFAPDSTSDARTDDLRPLAPFK